MMKYSVLMSVYKKDKPEYLVQSINSVMYQTIRPEEIVIVKDGPLSNELNIVIDEYKNRYPELFKIVESDRNLGLGLALNLGLKHCKNELVARMDADDIILPLKITNNYCK
jgi:glycosyltransferase involved in cell wall biosynthesis